MSTRYEMATEEVENIVKEVKYTDFPNTDGANILIVMDTKKKVSCGRIVIARIKKMNDELKFFTTDSVMGTEYDYVMFIDKFIFNELDIHDKKRIIFHELCHIDIDIEKKNPYGIRDHEIQGFYDEIEYNEDDPRWSERISVMVESLYDKD